MLVGSTPVSQLPVIDFQVVCEEVEWDGDDKDENVEDEEDAGGDVGRDDVPLHAVDVGQLAEEAEPVVDQRAHPFCFLIYFAHS
jgi:hypothetical protein